MSLPITARAASLRRRRSGAAPTRKRRSSASGQRLCDGPDSSLLAVCLLPSLGVWDSLLAKTLHHILPWRLYSVSWLDSVRWSRLGTLRWDVLEKKLLSSSTKRTFTRHLVLPPTCTKEMFVGELSAHQLANDTNTTIFVLLCTMQAIVARFSPPTVFFRLRFLKRSRGDSCSRSQQTGSDYAKLPVVCLKLRLIYNQHIFNRDLLGDFVAAIVEQ